MSRLARVAFSSLLLGAISCGERELPPIDMPAADGGIVVPPDAGMVRVVPIIAFIDPDFGPVEGGSFVTIRGSNFQDGATVALGGLFMDDVQIISDTEIEATTPAALQPGLADLLIANPDGAVGRLTDAFFYEPPPPVPIDFCDFTAPARFSAGVEQTFDVRGRVFSAGNTPGAGGAAGITVQAGFGFPGTDPASWTWLPARYAGDVDGLTAGDKANDEYRADISAILPSAYRAAMRASGDGGGTFTYCDRDGSTNGFSESATSEFTVRTRAVGFCQLEGPARVTAAPGLASAPLTGVVYAEGVTDAAGQGPGVRAQVGFGPVGQSVVELSWSWADAAYQDDAAGAGNATANDRYRGTLTALDNGQYDVAFRFSIDDGVTWTYCDLDGSTDGYSSAQAGELVVAPPQSLIDYCALLGPAQLSALPGSATVAIRVEIYQAGSTVGAGRGAGIRAELGYGPTTAAPGGPAWSFSEAAYEGDRNGLGTLDNDVYAGTVTASVPGTYAIAYRVSRDDGQTWTYCDLDGTDNGFDLENQTARLSVSAVSIGYCELAAPPSAGVISGLTTSFAGRVFVSGRTGGPGMGAGIRGQVGYGSLAASPTTWTFSEATYLRDVDGLVSGDLANDEYRADLAVAAAGTYGVAYRFSVDGGFSWTYCDRTGSLNGFAAADATELVVAPLQVGYCELTGPLTAPFATGSSGPTVTGRVYVMGRTPGAGRGADVRFELGYGPIDAAPSAASWTFAPATYARDVDGAAGGDLSNDEYTASLASAPIGSHAYAWRASVDNGVTFTYCDGDGSSNGFSLANAGRATVVAPGPPFGRCQLTATSPSIALRGAQTQAIDATVFVAGVTEAAGAGSGVVGAIGYGPVGTAPDTMTWTWLPAAYVSDNGTTSEVHRASFVAPAVGTYDLAARFTVNGGVTYHHCDLDGSDSGYDVAQAGKLVVREPIQSCNVQFPDTTTVVSGITSEQLFFRVVVPGVTSGFGRGAELTAEIGYGPVGASPTLNTWTWAVGTYNDQGPIGDADEYFGQLTLTAPTDPISYDYTMRFSRDGGSTYCYATLGAGAFARIDVNPIDVTEARIVGPQTIYGVVGLRPEPIYTQALVPGYHEPGLVTAELLYGALGSLPPAGFVAVDSAYNPFGPPGAYVEYETQLPATLAAGDYDLAARFERRSLLVGDLDGAAYTIDQAKHLHMRAPAGGGIDYCATQFPLEMTLNDSADGAPSPTVYGRVYKAGVTPGGGWGAGIAAEVGFGPIGDAPSSWTSWSSAGYRRNVDGIASGDQANDEYEGAFVIPPGTTDALGFAYRFSADGGATWTYCGLAPTGSSGAFLAGELFLQ